MGAAMNNAWQVVALVGLVGAVAVPLGGEIRRRFASRVDLIENDEARAERDQQAKRRVRPVSAIPKPEWLRRVERKWLAVGKVGEQRRVNLNGAKR